MELKQYFNIIMKRLWILLLLPLVAAGMSAYLSIYVLEPTYEANSTLYVVNKKADSSISLAQGDLMAGQLLVKDYREIIKSRAVTSAVIDELKLEELTPEKLASKISVNSKNDTRLIEIKVRDGNAVLARDMADKTSQVFIQMAVDLLKVENIQIIDKAILPESPVKPKPIINTAIALFAGIMTAQGIIFLLEYLDNRIKTVEDVEKYLGLPVIGTIPVLNIK